MLLPASAVLLFAALWGPNVLLAFCSILVLLVGAALLWRPSEPPILLLVFLFQWAQASVHLFSGTFLLGELETHYVLPDPGYATWLAMFGLVSIAVGIRISAGRVRIDNSLLVHQQINRNSQIRFLRIYLAAVALLFFASFIGAAVPGLRQPLLVASSLKWAAYVMFTIASFTKPEAKRSLWLLVFIVEFAMGLGGYFSSFKLVLIYTFLGIMATKYKPGSRALAGLFVLFFTALLLGSAWSQIKTDYRSYVNQGQYAQVVSVGYLDSLGKLYELASRMDFQDLQDGFGKMISRISYIGFFSAATQYVPARVPHSDGAILLDAVTRPLMPRLFFPGKPAVDESALVQKYTGVRVAGTAQGVSVSLGFYGESYVDFGVFGMIFGLFFWGLFLGLSYRWLVYGHYSRGILGFGLASAVLYQAFGIEVSSSKLFGGIVTALLVLYFFNRFIVPRYFSWLRLPGPRASSSRKPHSV